MQLPFPASDEVHGQGTACLGTYSAVGLLAKQWEPAKGLVSLYSFVFVIACLSLVSVIPTAMVIRFSRSVAMLGPLLCCWSEFLNSESAIYMK